MENEYLKYVGVLSSSLAAASAAYLITPQRPVTAAALFLLPLSYGFTAFISSESFQKASLASAICLAFIGFDPIVSAVAIALAVGNPAVSFFSSGREFKDFFSSVAIPMLLVGLAIGGATYHQASDSPEIRERLEEGVAAAVESQASLLVGSMEEDSRGLSRAVEATEKLVVADMRRNLTASQLDRLRSSFRSAEERLASDAGNSAISEIRRERIESASRNAASTLVTKRNLKALIPAAGLFMYSLSPLIGLLTALAGAGFREVTART